MGNCALLYRTFILRLTQVAQPVLRGMPTIFHYHEGYERRQGDVLSSPGMT